MRLFSMLKKNSKLALKSNWGGAIQLLLIIFGVSMLLSILQQIAITVFENGSSVSKILSDFFQSPELGVPEGFDARAIVTEYIIIGVFTILSLLFVAPLSLGGSRWFFRLVHRERIQISEVFHFFETSRLFGRALWYNINIYIRTFLWSILFFTVPGGMLGTSIFFLSIEDEISRSSKAIASTGIFLAIILMVLAGIFYAVCINRYALAPYLLAENDEISARRAIRDSVRYTKGFRFSLFWYELSFLGWGLLCALVLPLLFYVAPYYNTAFAMYARYIIEKNRYAQPNETKEFVTASGNSQPSTEPIREQPVPAESVQETIAPPAQEPTPTAEDGGGTTE